MKNKKEIEICDSCHSVSDYLTAHNAEF